MVALIIIVVLVLWICVSCIKIVPQAQAYVIERQIGRASCRERV